MGDDEEEENEEDEEPDSMTAGFAMLSEMQEQQIALQKRAIELQSSMVELTTKNNELLMKLLEYLKTGAEKMMDGATKLQVIHEALVSQPVAPAPPPHGKRRPSLSETAERLKQESEEQHQGK
jgi:hypothetical protein